MRKASALFDAPPTLEPARQIRVVIHDFPGHGFPVQLVVSWLVAVTPSATGTARRCRQERVLWLAGRTILPNSASRARNDLLLCSLLARQAILQEVGYGRQLGTLLRADRPDVVIFTNTSLLAHSLVATSCADTASRWSSGSRTSSASPSPRPSAGRWDRSSRGRSVDWPIDLERGSPPGRGESRRYPVPICRRWSDGASPSRTSVIPNWAPLPDLPVRRRDNSWAREHGLADRPVVLYSGTLGLKHNPSFSSPWPEECATRCLTPRRGGLGGEWPRLARRTKSGGEPRESASLDYQPYASYPDVLATADVLMALLQPSAGQYSAPSKVLSYLCAARPLVAVMPDSNAASAVVRDSGGGEVVQDDETAIAAVIGLLGAPEARARMGAAGRRYAEKAFDIVTKANRFEELIWTAWISPQAEPRAATRSPALPVPSGAVAAHASHALTHHAVGTHRFPAVCLQAQ